MPTALLRVELRPDYMSLFLSLFLLHKRGEAQASREGLEGESGSFHDMRSAA